MLFHSRISGVLLATKVTVAIGWIDDLSGVTMDPGWKHTDITKNQLPKDKYYYKAQFDLAILCISTLIWHLQNYI